MYMQNARPLHSTCEESKMNSMPPPLNLSAVVEDLGIPSIAESAVPRLYLPASAVFFFIIMLKKRNG